MGKRENPIWNFSFPPCIFENYFNTQYKVTSKNLINKAKDGTGLLLRE